MFGDSSWLFANPPGNLLRPKVFTWDLPMTYLAWVAACLALYPVCRWFSEYKARRKDLWWLTYL